METKETISTEDVGGRGRKTSFAVIREQLAYRVRKIIAADAAREIQRSATNCYSSVDTSRNAGSVPCLVSLC